MQWWWWWCSRDSDSSRWIELFALLKIVEERRRSWWGWWLNLLSSYSGSSVSRWRRLRSKAPPPLFLSPPVTLHVFSLFLFLFLLLSLGAQQVQPTRAARGINVGPKGPRIFMSRQREPRPWLCAAGGLSSPRSNVRNFCFLNSWIEAKADRHFLIRILLLFCIFRIRDRSLVFPFSFPCINNSRRVNLFYKKGRLKFVVTFYLIFQEETPLRILRVVTQSGRVSSSSSAGNRGKRAKVASRTVARYVG